ncbi:DUF1249 domain-containing protein [Pseudoalteromonas fenneropenaei]|uniref:DUF1249 domain-containing protein n=1 Tax=Pseudoalteromonas fenneropenaei TaxID=1737459 RepID=A0ABV7CHC6_9GAMM
MGLLSTQSYVQSLPKYIALCERNYLRLLKLLPAETVGACHEYHFAGEHYRLVVKNCEKYTTDVDLIKDKAIHTELPLWQLTLRLYHDAKVAEVVYPNYHQRVRPSYGYPNPDMHQKDEKYQVNAFLSDWLCACLENGRSTFHWDVNNDLV